MRLFTKLFTAIVLTCGAWFAGMAQQASGPETFYGFLNDAASWSDNGNTEPYWGFYRFAADGSSENFEAASPVGYDSGWALVTEGGGAATYDDGYFYCYTATGMWSSYTVKFYKLNAKNWKVEKSATLTAPSSGSLMVPVDITANPADGKLYVICRPKLGNSDKTILCTADRDNGQLTVVADNLPFFWTISSDAKGRLYAISAFGNTSAGEIYHAGNLYKVDTNGSITKIGYTGLSMFEKEKSATIDYRSGRMFLSHYGHEMNADGTPNYNNSIKGLYEINLNTGLATHIFTYPDYGHITGLSIINAHPQAPDNITDLEFAPKAAGSMTGVVSFTVPSRTYEQNPITGTVTASYYLDNELVEEKTVTAGSKISHELMVSGEGNHTILVSVKANGHDAIPVEKTAFFGTDTPKQVNNLTLKASEDALTATLTWDAPTEAVNGGYFDPEAVRYQIVRYPGNVTVVRSATATTFTETVDSEYAGVTYVVTPYLNGDTSKLGKAVRSNKVFLGTAWEMPYAEPFDYGDAWDSFTIIDANGDGGEWGWEDAVWKFDTVYYCAFFYHNGFKGAADDWMITPKLNLEKGKLYRLTYQAYGYYDYKSNDIEVYCGNTATVQGMHKLISKKHIYNKNINDRETITALFAPSEGDLYVGFRNVGEDENHLSIDNILVEEIGLSSVPGAVQDLKAEIENRTAGKVKISFTAPKNDAADVALNSNMNVKFYRGTDTEAFHSISNVKPGEAITYIDEKASPAVNIYRIVADNESGAGIENTVQIDLRAGMPQKVTNVMAVLTAPNQARITWNAPGEIVDENGNEIDRDNMRYLVYRPLGNNEYDIIGRGLKECEFIDDNPRVLNGDTQAAIYYYVAAVNGDGLGEAVSSNVIYVGNPYKLPFKETWTEQIAKTDPWLLSNSGTASWSTSSKGYSPNCDGQDGMGIMSMYLGYDCTEGSSIIWSPRMDLSEVKDAKLTFWIYGNNIYTDNDYISVAVAADNDDPVRISSATYYPKRWAGWKQQTVDLSDFVGKSNVSILIMGNLTAPSTTDERRLHIDNVEVSGTPAPNELRISVFSGSSEVREGIPATYNVTVYNPGTADAENIPVALYSDGRKVASSTVEYLNAGEDKVVELSFAPVQGRDELVELVAEITPTAAQDINIDNNSMSLAVKVLPMNLPYITELSGTYYPEAKEAVLEWGAPSKAEYTESIIDGAEAYDAFAIADYGCWTPVDNDGNAPFKFSDPSTGQLITWDNNDQLQAWMVFRPSDVTSDRTFQVKNGLQAFASWSNADVKGTGVGNDDWLISPELSGDNQLISFWVRRLNERDNNEQYNVLVSTTDKELSSFTRLNGDTPLSASSEWDIEYFALPKGAKYFAIQNVGYHQSAILIDDIQFEAYPTHMRPDGYNIYRNGVKLNSTPTTRRSFTDSTVPFEGSHTYVVRPVFSGVEADESTPFVLTPAGISGVTGEQIAVIAGKGVIRVINAQGNHLDVYRLDATHVASHNVATADEAISAPAGIYVVKVGTATFKVIVR